MSSKWMEECSDSRCWILKNLSPGYQRTIGLHEVLSVEPICMIISEMTIIHWLLFLTRSYEIRRLTALPMKFRLRESPIDKRQVEFKHPESKRIQFSHTILDRSSVHVACHAINLSMNFIIWYTLHCINVPLQFKINDFYLYTHFPSVHHIYLFTSRGT